jgi:lipopolysaccharide/colanic/teichoic acid biosynthesis glycosyltransferase
VFGIALLVQGLIAYIEPGQELVRYVMFIGVAFNFAAMVAWRIAYASLLARVFAAEPVLFFGTDDVLREIAAKMVERPELGYRIAGFLSDELAPKTLIVEGGEVIGGSRNLLDLVAKLRPKSVIVGMHEMRSQLPVAALMSVRKTGVVVQDAGLAYELVCGRVCSRTFRPSQIIFANELARRPSAMALQSIYTNLLGLTAYVCAIPVLVAATVAIRLTSRGPALLTETRLGLNGIPFTTSHFRCTLTGDPARETRLGRFIRFLHLEYLPRVINLVRGDVALVGPAPLRPEFAECLAELIPFYRQRQSVKPGLTGWTQIQTGPGELQDALRELECDLYYTKHISLALDAYILLRTIRGMLPFNER